MGMSGGVDSSMALLLLKRSGWDPIGVSLKLPVWSDPKNTLRENICCTAESLQTAKMVCDQLEVPYYVYDVQKEFSVEVTNYFLQEVASAHTPNPCVICNRRLKFKQLFAFAAQQGVDYVATGHYARIRKNEGSGKYELLMAKDKGKDQTYSLCFLPQEWLGNIIFPLGEYLKKDVYQLASETGFASFTTQKESQNFCFVSGSSLPAYLEQELGTKPGLIVDSWGTVLGEHRGLHFYTIGQRKGLRLPGGPYYVQGYDEEKNHLLASRDPEEGAKKEVTLSPYSFTSGEDPVMEMVVEAKIRYHQPLARAVLSPPREGKLQITFEEEQKAVTPGQFVVFYECRAREGEVCLGGGRIT